MGWAQHNLTAETRDRIARTLFVVQQEDGDWLNGLCPFHDDRTMSFGYNVTNDVFKCFASCTDSGDLVDLWCKVKGYPERSTEGLRAFKREYAQEGLAPAPRKTPGQLRTRLDVKLPGEIPENVFSVMEPVSDAMMGELSRRRGWTRETLDELGVRALSHFRRKANLYETFPIRERDRVAIPIRDEKGVLRNIRVYYPLGKPESAPAKIMSWGKGHGSAMLFPAASTLRDGLVILCEGEADCICARSHGLNAITQTGKPDVWPKSHLNALAGREILLCYDADKPGQAYADKAEKNLTRAGCTVFRLEWPDFMGRENGEWPDDHGQDLTDFFVRHRQGVGEFMTLVGAARERRENARKDVAGTPETSAPDVGFMRFFDSGVNGRLSFREKLLADWLAEHFPMLYHDESGQLYRWEGRFFEPWSVEQLKREAIIALGDEATASRVNGSCSLVLALASMPSGRELDDREDWACLENGMLNLRTLEFIPHDRDFLATVKLGVTWHGEKPPKPERWLRFLGETVQTPEVIMQLQEFIGYSMTRDTTMGKALLLLGPGADGKSKVISIMRALVGQKNCSAVTIAGLEDQFQRASLFRKMLNVGAELSAEATNSEFFKNVVTGDPIQASFKHKDSFEFRPYCKLAYAMNKKPRVLDNSDGFFRRILPVQFKRQFLEDDPTMDNDLESKLMAELDGIFAWAVLGLHRLMKNKRFTSCDETTEFIMKYRRYNNPVMAFVQDQCTLEDGYDEDLKELYKAYKSYCTEGGYKPLNRENFIEELETATRKLREVAVKVYRPRVEGKRPQRVSGISLTSGFTNSL